MILHEGQRFGSGVFRDGRLRFPSPQEHYDDFIA